MQFTLKAREISKIIGVDPKKINKWSNEHNVPHEKDENGSYLYDVYAIEKIKEIATDEINHDKPNKLVIDLEGKMDALLEKIDLLEMKLTNRVNSKISDHVKHHQENIHNTLQNLNKLERKADSELHHTTKLPYTG